MSNVGVFDLWGDVAPGTLFSSSFPPSGNLNFRRRQQRDLYDDILLGTATRDRTGEPPESGSSVAYSSQKATTPSWVRRQIGVDHGYVIPAFSSSRHEETQLNCYHSGVFAVETTAVPHSASQYYSKRNRFQKIVYKLSASVNLPNNPGNLYHPVIDEFGSRATGSNGFYPISGSYRNCSVNDPAVFEFDVVEKGKIRDIKVWVEFIHDSRVGVTGSDDHSSRLDRSGSLYGIGNIAIAIRSPNTNFEWAHPIWNSKDLLARVRTQLPSASLFRNSYLLWAGPAADGLFKHENGWIAEYDTFLFSNVYDQPVYLVPNQLGQSYAVYDSDIDMRTIFHDGAHIRNPRDVSPLFVNATQGDPGLASGTITGITSSDLPIYWPGPMSIVAEKIYNGANDQLAANPQGGNIPWMLDDRVPPGGLALSGSTVLSYEQFLEGDSYVLTSSMIVPEGWWKSGSNEFHSYGAQIGPPELRPFYPLLDDVFVRKMTAEPIDRTYLRRSGALLITLPLSDLESSFVSTLGKIEGFRPGLRGTEVLGKWQLLIGMGNIERKAGIWFRHARIEFIVDKGEESNSSAIGSRWKKFERSGYVPRGFGKRLVSIISGSLKNPDFPLNVPIESDSENFSSDSESPDLGTNYVYVQDRDEYGRTVGITDRTGSSPDSFAVLTYITGNLYTRLSGSGQAALYHYLRNEFGTPYIPVSSGSGVDPSFQPFTEDDARLSRLLVDRVLIPQPLVNPFQEAQAVLKRGNFIQDTRSLYLRELEALEAELEDDSES
jgi:hypothetical protein